MGTPTFFDSSISEITARDAVPLNAVFGEELAVKCDDESRLVVADLVCAIIAAVDYGMHISRDTDNVISNIDGDGLAHHLELILIEEIVSGADSDKMISVFTVCVGRECTA